MEDRVGWLKVTKAQIDGVSSGVRQHNGGGGALLTIICNIF